MRPNYDIQRIEERRRNDSLRSKRHEHAVRRYEADLADQEQRRVEREERWKLEKMEREARLVHSSWMERIQIGTNLVGLACAIILLVAGIRSDQAILGGSGAAGITSALWLLHSFLGRKREPAAQSSNPPLTADGKA